MTRTFFLAVSLLLALAAFAVSAQSTALAAIRSDFTDLKAYDPRPLYKVSVTSETFAYQVRVNDLPVFTNTGKIKGTVNFFVNQAVLHSGKQSLSIHLMPQAGADRLPDSSDFQLVLVETGWIKGGGMVPPRTVVEYQLPKAPFEDGKAFNRSFAFDATVPYKLDAWTHSVVLNADDPQLKAEAIEAYNGLIQRFARKDGAGFMGALAKAEWSAFQTNYFTPPEAKRQHDTWVAFVKDGKEKMAPLENHALEVRQDGRLVRLKRTDAGKEGEGWYYMVDYN